MYTRAGGCPQPAAAYNEMRFAGVVYPLDPTQRSIARGLGAMRACPPTVRKKASGISRDFTSDILPGEVPHSQVLVRITAAPLNLLATKFPALGRFMGQEGSLPIGLSCRDIAETFWDALQRKLHGHQGFRFHSRGRAYKVDGGRIRKPRDSAPSRWGWGPPGRIALIRWYRQNGGMVTASIRNECFNAFLKGFSLRAIAAKHGVGRRTLERWSASEHWSLVRWA
jgi:hypothetical protein